MVTQVQLLTGNPAQKASVGVGEQAALMHVAGVPVVVASGARWCNCSRLGRLWV